MFAAQLLALWTHRLDYPLIDDWRYYNNLYRMPVDLSPTWLFAAARDTVHATGKLLDWLTFRWLGHDYRLLAATSFLLWFGGWALVSVAIALRVTRDQPVVRFAALGAFALPLAASPYWVTVSPLQKLEPAVAYHQMMPMLGLSLLFLLCLLCIGQRGSTLSRCVAAAAATTFFSLAYSSGAVSHLLFGATVATLSAMGRSGGPRGPLVALGLVVCVTAASCLVLHIALPLDTFDINPVVEARTKRMSLTPPWELDFWTFFVGLFDRAVFSLSTETAGRIRGLVVVAAIGLLGGVLAVRATRGRLSKTEQPIAIALVALFVAVVGYAALVAYGRASFGPMYFGLDGPQDTGLRASLYAHSRFFYWWITAILPFAVIALAMILRRHSPRAAGAGACALVILGLGSALLHWQSWDYPARYRHDADQVRAMIEQDRRRWPGSPAMYRTARDLEANFLDRWRFNPGSRRPRDHEGVIQLQRAKPEEDEGSRSRDSDP